MKLCPSCGAQVADNAPICPQCGAPLQVTTSQQVVSGKSKTTAALLAFFLGYLGIHYFYLNKPIMGVVCLGLTFGTAIVGAWVLPLVNFIGLLVSDEKHFQEEWLNPEKKFPIW